MSASTSLTLLSVSICMEFSHSKLVSISTASTPGLPAIRSGSHEIPFESSVPPACTIFLSKGQHQILRILITFIENVERTHHCIQPDQIRRLQMGPFCEPKHFLKIMSMLLCARHVIL